MISQYGDVYVRALDWSCSRSSLVSPIRNGLDLGKPVTSTETKSGRERNLKGYKRRHRIYDMEYSAAPVGFLPVCGRCANDQRKTKETLVKVLQTSSDVSCSGCLFPSRAGLA